MCPFPSLPNSNPLLRWNLFSSGFLSIQIAFISLHFILIDFMNFTTEDVFLSFIFFSHNQLSKFHIIPLDLYLSYCVTECLFLLFYSIFYTFLYSFPLSIFHFLTRTASLCDRPASYFTGSSARLCFFSWTCGSICEIPLTFSSSFFPLSLSPFPLSSSPSPPSSCALFCSFSLLYECQICLGFSTHTIIAR